MTGWNFEFESFVRRLFEECSRGLDFQVDLKTEQYCAKCLLTKLTITESNLRPKILTVSGKEVPAATIGRTTQVGPQTRAKLS